MNKEKRIAIAKENLEVLNPLREDIKEAENQLKIANGWLEVGDTVEGSHLWGTHAREEDHWTSRVVSIDEQKMTAEFKVISAWSTCGECEKKIGDRWTGKCYR